jgi:uncharacterized protein (DUF58 family)
VAQSVLSRYLDPDVLNHVADRSMEPRGLVVGNLAGHHRSPMSGFAVEFAGHREYAPGDDPKHIDWRVYFTRDKYFIKQYEMETNFVCHLVLDVSASMRYGDGDENKLLYGARLATTLGHSIVRQSDKVSLATFDDRVRGFVPPSNAMGQIVRMTEHLDEIEPREKTLISECLTELAGRMKRREIVIVLSDFFTDLASLESAIQRLRYQRHEVVLMQVMHHDELAFEFDGMVKFIGLEIPEEMLARPDDLRAAYLAAMEKFNGDLEAVAHRNRVEYLLVDTRRNLGEVLVDYLNSRAEIHRAR